ncbi:restriction endonuclease subunit S [Streptomyces sp. NPDC047097]|uniref:restriction endonuclease subunit S n=1 Tax=Streptomyces sp. NPDC047097 TaxID=3155260 RepID=UPI0033DDB780
MGISGSELKNIAFPVPPLAEQRSIVAALEEQFSRLDAAEVSLADATRRTSLVIRSVLNQFFTSSATRARGWQLEHLENVAEIRGGQTPRKDSVIFHTEWSPGFFPFWKVGDMNGADGRLLTRSRTYLSPDQAQDARVRIHPAGTVVIPKRGGAISTNKKRVTATAGAFDLNTMGIIPKGRLVPEFLWYWFQTINLQDLADGSNVPQINRPDLRHLQVPVPNESEQRSVVQHLDSLFAHMDRAQGMAVTVRPHLLKQALLGKAFTGHLVPQDPSNEPAEAMLAQIRVERGAAEASKLRRGSPRGDAQRKRDTSSAPDMSPPPPATSLSIPAVTSQPALDLEIPS